MVFVVFVVFVPERVRDRRSNSVKYRYSKFTGDDLSERDIPLSSGSKKKYYN